MTNTDNYVESLKEYLGDYGISFFRHLKGLIGNVFPVLRLNAERKGIPVYQVWFHEGMDIRNFQRTRHPEIDDDMTYDEFEDLVPELVEKAIL